MRSIELADTELRIDGVPRVLLCASLFPFRVPRHQWAERIAAVQALGYHALDVYIPWNYHETEPGVWHFGGERDIEEFLILAEAAGLLVLARPGPYICSEWDGGGLPAWLGCDSRMRLRQHDPRYLAEVERWHDRIMPILGRHQYPDGGCVILVQVENELDFFDCEDPAGYIGALAISARRHGITVPLIACAGQGDIARATGGVIDVVPAVNLYPSDDAADVEEHAAYAESALRQRRLPLLVTETNRLHRTLKRMLTSGARLLGPYLQASGWTGEYGTSVNNWGNLLAFMTHDYDFGGVLDPTGAERGDAAEARGLAALVDALGPRLAAATPAGPAKGVAGRFEVMPYAVDLAGGGQLLSVTNLAAEPREVQLSAGSVTGVATIAAGECALLVREVPAGPAEIVLAAAELTQLSRSDDDLRVGFTTRGHSDVWLRVAGEATVDRADGLAAFVAEGLVRVSGIAGQVVLRADAARITVVFEPSLPAPIPSISPRHTVTEVAVSEGAGAEAWTVVATASAAMPLERLGIYRGAGRYSASLKAPGTIGLVLRDAADILDVELGAHRSPWLAHGGGDLWLPIDARGDDALGLRVTTRIWGHSNFDDARLPSLRLGSLRGIAGALAVTHQRPLRSGWLVGPAAGPEVGAAPSPRGDLGGWMSSQYPQAVTYRRTIGHELAGPAAFHLRPSQARLTTAVNDVVVGTLSPLRPTLWLGELQPGDELAITVERSWGEPVGELTLLRGYLIDNWRVERQSTAELLTARGDPARSAATLPVSVPVGDGRWVHVAGTEFPTGGANVVVRLTGRGLLVTALAGDHHLGRLWTGAPAGAQLRGGRGDLLIVPRAWADRGLDLYLEATTGVNGHLDAVSVGGPVDVRQEGHHEQV